MAKFDESSNFTEALSNFHRLERPSCLGSALHQACFLEFPFFVKRKATWLYAEKIQTWWIRRRPTNTTLSDEYDVVRRIDIIIFVQEKKPLKLLHFCFGNTGVPIYKKIGNFFFNFKVCHKIDGNLLHSYGFLKVDILNFKSYAIGSGHAVASLPTIKLQSQVIFFQVLFFVS